MNKFKIFISAIIILLIIATFSIVYAEPTITVTEESVKLNDEFNIGIDTGQNMKNVTFTLEYDSKIFQYINSTTENVDITTENGKLVIVPNNATELKNYAVTLTFKVISDSVKTSNVVLGCSGVDESGRTLNLTGLKGLTIVSSNNNVQQPVNNTIKDDNEIKEEVTNNNVEDVEEMPNTGSLNYIIPFIIVILLISIYFVNRQNKNMFK